MWSGDLNSIHYSTMVRIILKYSVQEDQEDLVLEVFNAFRIILTIRIVTADLTQILFELSQCSRRLVLQKHLLRNCMSVR